MLKKIEMGMSVEYSPPSSTDTLAVDWFRAEGRWSGSSKEMYSVRWVFNRPLTEEDRAQVLLAFGLWDRRDEFPADVLWSKGPVELRMGSELVAA